jgi:divalent metal cation (Fe/Co/Zn/Cd) transporter
MASKVLWICFLALFFAMACFKMSNTAVLVVVLAMNLGITIAQGFAAMYANSLALLMDDIQMGIDTFTCTFVFCTETQNLTTL